MKTFMGTTAVSVERTIGEITEYLRDAGALEIMTEYRDKRVTALTFSLMVGEKRIPFLLPVRPDKLFTRLQRERSPRTRERMVNTDRQQADRIAWRQILRWIQAQLALIDTGMVAPAEVFMPYIRLCTGQTAYERLEFNAFKALPLFEAEET